MRDMYPILYVFILYIEMVIVDYVYDHSGHYVHYDNSGHHDHYIYSHVMILMIMMTMMLMRMKMMIII